MAGKAAAEKLKTHDNPAETLCGARRTVRGTAFRPWRFGVPTSIPAPNQAKGRLFAGMTFGRRS